MTTSKKKRIANARKILEKAFDPARSPGLEDGPASFDAFIDRVHQELTWEYFPEQNPSKMSQMVGALSDITGFDATLNAGRLHALAKDMLVAGYEPEELPPLYDLKNPRSPWCLDWRSNNRAAPGVKTQPSEAAVRATVKGFLEQVERHGGARSLDEL